MVPRLVFAAFIFVKIQKIANNSATSEARAKISRDQEILIILYFKVYVRLN
jgi:hypothetical protein